MEVGKFLGIDKLNPLARANLLAARILRLPDSVSEDIVDWILEISCTFEEINAGDVRLILNDARRKSGFPEITDLSVVEKEIRNQRYFFNDTIVSVIENLFSPLEMVNVVNLVVDSASSYGENTWPILITDLLDSYERGTQELLKNLTDDIIETHDKKLREDIETQNEKLQTKVSDNSGDYFTTLRFTNYLELWGKIARPSQISKKIRGQRHDESLRLAPRVRQLAIHLFNEYDKLNISQQILNVLKSLCAEVPEFTEQITVDIETLNKIAEQRAQKKN